VQLPVYKLLVPNVFTPDGSPGYNDNFEIGFGADGLTPGEAGQKVQLIVINRWGKKVFESQDYKNDWKAQDLEGGVYYFDVKIGELAACKSWVHIVK
jgi:CHU_C Type IX secretion signal domain